MPKHQDNNWSSAATWAQPPGHLGAANRRPVLSITGRRRTCYYQLIQECLPPSSSSRTRTCNGCYSWTPFSLGMDHTYKSYIICIWCIRLLNLIEVFLKSEINFLLPAQSLCFRVNPIPKLIQVSRHDWAKEYKKRNGKNMKECRFYRSICHFESIPKNPDPILVSTVLGPHTHVYMHCIMYRYAPSRPSLWLKARTLS